MVEVRPCRDRDELARAVYGIAQYFGSFPGDDLLDRLLRVLELERMHAAFDDGEIVGGAGAVGFDLSVPGGSLPCAGVTVVGVYATHRRRGVLRAMMDAQLRDVYERGEPLAALWASDEAIYGRFGYGLASWTGAIELERVWNAYARPLERRGNVRLVSAEAALELFPPLWDVLWRERPGVFARSRAWWETRRLRRPDEEKPGERTFAVAEIDGAPSAYAIFRLVPGFEKGVPAGKLVVLEAVGATPQSTAEIWRFLLDIDWYATLEATLLPPDHALFSLLANPRRARYRMGDGLWMRIVDVGAALAGRAYAGAGSIVIEVRDAVCPWNDGRWKLAGGAAARTGETAELALDVDALGSAYLGAVSFAQLRDGLRVEELVDGAVARADAIFAWRPLPWCPEIF